MLTVLLGGARSGKSALAIEMAAAGPGPVTFVATAQAGDAEMAARIEAHRRERPPEWATIEEPVALCRALGEVGSAGTVLVDCLTLWVSNMIGTGSPDEEVAGQALRAASLLSGRDGEALVVSNEVGSGIVPADALSRRFRDVLGRVNTLFCSRAANAYLVVAGRVLALQTPPVPPGRGARGA